MQVPCVYTLLLRSMTLQPLGCSKVDSAFHPSEVNQMSTRTSWRLVVQTKLSPCSDSAGFEIVKQNQFAKISECSKDL